MREDLRKLGADAARQGLGLLDCPLFPGRGHAGTHR